MVNIAQCITLEDKANMKTTYGTLKAACLATGTPISFSVDEFLEAGGETTTTTTTPLINSTPVATTFVTSSTPESSPAPVSPPSAAESQTKTQQKEGLSQSDIIAIAIGVPVGVFTILGAIITWCMCCRH